MGPCGEADSTSERILFLTSGLPLFQLLNKILPPLRCYFCCPLCPVCGSDPKMGIQHACSLQMRTNSCLSATLRSPSVFLFWSPSLFLYILLCLRGQAPQMHSLCEECRGFWEQMSCRLRPPTLGPASAIQGNAFLLQFPL